MLYARELLGYLIKATRRPNRRVLRRQERKTQRIINAEFRKQRKLIVEAYAEITDQKQIKAKASDFNEVFEDLNEEMNIKILKEEAKTMKFGAKYRIRKSKLGQLGISFDLSHPLAVEYLKTDRPLVLSKLEDTTKDLIKPILVAAAKEGSSPQEVAKTLQQEFAFSKSRSLMIATNEIGTAYEYGNHIPIKDAVAEGFKATKRWATVRDNRVTQECEHNENQGWIKDSEIFPSGDDEAPRATNPRCRCTTLYKIK